MNHQGTTLIGLVVSISIIAVALMGTLIAINTASLYSANPLLIQQATAIASSYLEEITSKLFINGTCPTPSGGRSTYTYLCQYSGISEAPTDQNGNLVSGLGDYTVTVTVDTSGASLGGLVASVRVNRIDVKVTHNLMPSITLSSYRTNY